MGVYHNYTRKEETKLMEELATDPYLVAKIEEFEEKRLKKMSKNL